MVRVSRQLLQPKRRKRGENQTPRVWDKESSRKPHFIRVLKPWLQMEELLGEGAFSHSPTPTIPHELSRHLAHRQHLTSW